MKQILYGDVLFFVNFTMDFLTLFITAKILHRKVRPSRLVAAAVIGAVYGVAACFMGGILLFKIVINIAVSLLMCYVSFDKGILSCCALFYGTGCLLGGAMTAVYGLMNSMFGARTVYVDGSYRTLSGDIPLGWMAVVAGVAGIAAVAGGQFSRRSISSGQIQFTVFCGKKTVRLTGLYDSGNLLTDPITGTPVIITTRKALISMVPDALIPYFSNENIASIPDIPTGYVKHIRLIPVQSVGGGGLLTGFVPTYIKINGKEKSAVIAADDKISDFGGCDALMPAVLCDGISRNKAADITKG